MELKLSASFSQSAQPATSKREYHGLDAEAGDFCAGSDGVDEFLFAFSHFPVAILAKLRELWKQSRLGVEHQYMTD